MSNLSLEASIRTCKVDTAWAARAESDRFLNPNNMVCIPWGGQNLKGQSVCADSFYTKTPGCNSAEDRVQVENGLRPQYSQYVTLNAGAGIGGHIYGQDTTAHINSVNRTKFIDSRDQITGNYGKQLGSEVRYTACGINAYENGMAQQAQANRQAAQLNNSYWSQQKADYSGGNGSCGY